jgi:SPX domain protein involved in polyphosphate accumulation
LSRKWMTLQCKNFSHTIEIEFQTIYTFQCVGWRNHCRKVSDVSRNGTMISADLGSSSNYSNELQSQALKKSTFWCWRVKL